MTTLTFSRFELKGVRATMLGALVLAMVGQVACEGPIFKPDEPRSQYDRMDMVRNTREPSYLPDEMGTLRPNLAGRLSGVR